jgi:hypothetical protein
VPGLLVSTSRPPRSPRSAKRCAVAGGSAEGRATRCASAHRSRSTKPCSSSAPHSPTAAPPRPGARRTARMPTGSLQCPQLPGDSQRTRLCFPDGGGLSSLRCFSR